MSVDYLVVGPDGRELAVEPDRGWGPAVLLVEPVTDALKQVSGGRIVGSFDRDRVLAVVGFGLADEIVQLLGTAPNRPRDIHRAVLQLGYRWETHPL